MLYCLPPKPPFKNVCSSRFWGPEDNRQRSVQTKFSDVRRAPGFSPADFASALSPSPDAHPSPHPAGPPHRSSRPPPPPTPSTTANNSAITDFFPPTAGDSANLLIKDPITMDPSGRTIIDRSTAVLILADSCVGASPARRAPSERGPGAQSPRPPHLHRALPVRRPLGTVTSPRLGGWSPGPGIAARRPRGRAGGRALTSDGSGTPHPP